MAQVAWLGVQPSPMGGGEAPIAQEPQPELEATSEEKLEQTPEDTPAATPMEIADEAGDGNVDTYYVADMTTVQDTWDPWPSPAQDTPLCWIKWPQNN